MNLILKRIALKDTYTIGKLYNEDAYLCDTLEDKVRDLNKNGKFDNGEVKVHGETAIPYGKYRIIITKSTRFGRDLPLLENVSSFEGIRIHPGNDSGDTEGCILLGENKVKGKVLNSRITFNKVFSLIEKAISNKEDVFITIM